jgi:hypothetical protein
MNGSTASYVTHSYKPPHREPPILMIRSTPLALLLAQLLITQGLLACSDPDPGDPPVFPEDYAATYQEVRSCRLSVDHDLTRMRVLA